MTREVIYDAPFALPHTFTSYCEYPDASGNSDMPAPALTERRPPPFIGWRAGELGWPAEA